MSDFNIKRDLIGGGILSKSGILSQWPFVLYIVILIITYISLNLGVQKAHLRQEKNLSQIKNLKADYTSKIARLQNVSSREQIKLLLEKHGSTLRSPQRPAQRVKKIKRGY